MEQRSVEDFYELLGVARTASKAEIEQRTTELARTWIGRTGLSDLDRRQKAERMVRRLDEARQVLLDDASRRAYDRQLEVAPSASAEVVPFISAPRPVGGRENWLEQARRALSMNDFHTAAYAAREARPAHGETAELWSILARAHAGLRQFSDAVVEAQRAVALEPNIPERHLTLAKILEALGNWDAALRCYETAGQLDSLSDAPRLGVASVHLQRGDTSRGLSLLEDMFTHGRDRQLAGDHLAMALRQAAQEIPQVRREGAYLITSRREITRMRSLLERAEGLTQSPAVLADLAQTLGHVERSAGRQIVWSRLTGFLGKLYIIVLGIMVTVWLATDSPTPFLIALTVGGACLFLHARVPRWKVNKWDYHGEVASTQKRTRWVTEGRPGPH